MRNEMGRLFDTKDTTYMFGLRELPDLSQNGLIRLVNSITDAIRAAIPGKRRPQHH